jgi:6-phosphogluconolactonase
MKAFIRTLLLLALAAMMGCGSSSTVTKPLEFLYAVGQPNNIFTVNILTSGEMQSASIFSTPTAPRPVAMVLHPSTNFLYVANLTSNAVSGFSVDHATGVLAPVGNALPPTPTDPQPTALGIDPGGHFLFVMTQGNPAATIPARISTFLIDARGLLTAGSSVDLAAPAQTLVVSPTANMLYVATGASIAVFSIGTNGALTPAAGGFTGAPGTSIAGMTIDSKGQFLYAADSGNNAVLSFTIDTSGALTPVGGSPFTAGTQPVSVAVDANNAFLYTANKGSNDISAFTVNAGVLTPVAGSPFPATTSGVTTAAQPAFITIDPTNQFVFVGNPGSSNISGFAISLADGSLVAVTNSPFAAVGATSIIVVK